MTGPMGLKLVGRPPLPGRAVDFLKAVLGARGTRPPAAAAEAVAAAQHAPPAAQPAAMPQRPLQPPGAAAASPAAQAAAQASQQAPAAGAWVSGLFGPTAKGRLANGPAVNGRPAAGTAGSQPAAPRSQPTLNLPTAMHPDAIAAWLSAQLAARSVPVPAPAALASAPAAGTWNDSAAAVPSAPAQPQPQAQAAPLFPLPQPAHAAQPGSFAALLGLPLDVATPPPGVGGQQGAGTAAAQQPTADHAHNEPHL